jgi:hypothetical protein
MGAFLAVGQKMVDHYKKKLQKRASGEGGGSQPHGTPKPPPVPDFHKGGMVKRTGLAKLHKGERVLTKRQQKGRSKY